MNKHILIIGGGSIGKRHAKNLAVSGCVVSVVDPRKDRRDELDLYVNRYESLSHVHLIDFAGVVIATPPACHLEQCLWAAMAGLPILCEKGITLDINEARQIQRVVDEYKIPFLMGYTWRWWPTLNWLFNEYMQRIQPLRHVEMRMCAHLEDWHPWEPLKDFYIATRGGVKNENHWIDVMLWQFGLPADCDIYTGKTSSLDITQDDTLSLFAQYRGFNVNIHLNLFARPHERSIRLVGEGGTLKWTPNLTVFCDSPEGQWSDKGPDWQMLSATDYDRNTMFLHEMTHFLEVIDGAKPQCTVQDGVRVIELLNVEQ
ncbi:MAG: Gfo/Idh/MocA family oxidoreductase [Nitrososphaera sp.]|nr:Gfo/Idh/MocA family oxidoreductase [Nitrososphaera sp.]